MKYLLIILFLFIQPDSTKVIKKSKSFEKMSIEQKEQVLKRKFKTLDSLIIKQDSLKKRRGHER